MALFRSSFSFRKTEARKGTSQNPLRFGAEEFAREYGLTCDKIDVHIGDQKLSLDPTSGEWYPDGKIDVAVSTRVLASLEKKKDRLEEENQILRTKIDLLLEMLAEVTAEYDLRQKSTSK